VEMLYTMHFENAYKGTAYKVKFEQDACIKHVHNEATSDSGTLSPYLLVELCHLCHPAQAP